MKNSQEEIQTSNNTETIWNSYAVTNAWGGIEIDLLSALIAVNKVRSMLKLKLINHSDTN